LSKPPNPWLLYSFREERDIRDCRLITDSVFGGKTQATISYESQLPLNLLKDDHNFRYRELYSYEETEKDNEGSIRHDTPLNGCIKFSGVLNLDLPDNNKNIERSGFACLQSPKTVRPLDLNYCTGLEIRVKTDGRLYVLQMKTDTRIEDEIYQAILPSIPSKDKWYIAYVPFSDFLLTWRGYADQHQVGMELKKVRHFAILMAERKAGPFCCYIDWIKAVEKTHLQRKATVREDDTTGEDNTSREDAPS